MRAITPPTTSGRDRARGVGSPSLERARDLRAKAAVRERSGRAAAAQRDAATTATTRVRRPWGRRKAAAVDVGDMLSKKMQTRTLFFQMPR
jgi:hypothetical protein